MRLMMPALLVPLLAAVLGQQPAPDWVKVADKAGWQPRDSQGEVVFKDQLWILGGWFDSFSAPPRDVWSSADGKEWKLEADKAGWSPRLAAGAVVFKDRMWILGGTENYYFGDGKSLKNDIWSSADGKEWKRETDAAPWSPRAYHAAVVHDGKIWVMGGGNYVPKYHALNDVWCSTDGVKWEQVTDKAPWHPRIWFSSVVYRDRIWVLGGWSNNPSKNWGDVWYSKNGKDWQQLASKVCWKERHEHSAFVFKDRIWVAGGHAQPLSREVWSLEVPKDWFKGQ